MANHFSALKRARQTERRTAATGQHLPPAHCVARFSRNSLEKGQTAATKHFQNRSILDKPFRKDSAREYRGRYKHVLREVNALK